MWVHVKKICIPLILNTIKKLETDDQGNILTTNANLKLLRTLTGEIKKDD